MTNIDASCRPLTDSATPPDGRHHRPAGRWSDQRITLIAGGAYVLALVFYEDLAAHVFGVSLQPRFSEVRASAVIYQLVELTVLLPVLAAIMFVVVHRPNGELRLAFARVSWRVAVGTVVAVGVTRVALDFVGLWPFGWRSALSTEALYLSAVIANAAGGSAAAFAMWITKVVLLVPICEEVIFRFAVIRAVVARTGSSLIAIGTSSALFALGHLGLGMGVTAIPAELVWHAAWLFLLAVVLGWATARAAGRIGVAIIAHATVNGVSLLALLGALGHSA